MPTPWWMLSACAAVVLLSGCGTVSAPVAASQVIAQQGAGSRAHPGRSDGSAQARRARSARGSGLTSQSCPSVRRTLSGVYHPSRLRVLDHCRRALGTVDRVRHEQDGDLHVDVALSYDYRSLLDAENVTAQRGDLVVEFMARDGGHLPEPHVGQQIALTGAWVDDTLHGWNELHPVWSVSLNGGATHVSGPQFGGSPSGDRSYDAAADCRTQTGARCRGYGFGAGTADDRPPAR